MSLEESITRLAAAVEANTAARLGQAPDPQVKKSEKPAATKSAATQTIAAPQASAVPATKAESSEPPPYKDVQTILYELCNKKGVENSQKFIASLGYKKMTDAKPEDYAGIIEKFRAELAK